MTAVRLSTKIPALMAKRPPRSSHGTTTWYRKFGSWIRKTSTKMPTEMARAAAMVAMETQSPFRGSRLPTAMLTKNDASGRNGMRCA